MIGKVRLSSAKLLSPTVKELTFSALEGDFLKTFQPGSHIDINTPVGWRSYSLLDTGIDPKHYRIAVRKVDAPAGGSHWLHHHLHIGQTVEIVGPKDNFNLSKSQKKGHIMFAGGIGITPLIGIASHLVVQGKSPLIYFTFKDIKDKDLIDALIPTELREEIKVHYHYSYEQGRLDFSQLIYEQNAQDVFYCCGPTGMLDDFLSLMTEQGISDFHFERFHASRKEIVSGEMSQCSLYLKKSDLTLTVSNDKYILDALKDAGINVLYSCESGICGTCETRIIEGRVEHNDSILSPSEREKGDRAMLCTARALGKKLVLEL